VKLCDFGLAETEKLPPNALYGKIGTAPFMSPEMVKGLAYDRGTDIWSFGATAYMMLYGRYLYKIDRDLKKKKGVRASELMHKAIASNSPEPKYVAGEGLPEPSPLAVSFLKTILKRDPNTRSTAYQLLRHRAMAQRSDVVESRAATNASSLGPTIKLAKQATDQFKVPVDPTVAKSMDVLLGQLQRKFQREPVAFTQTFSLPITGEKSLGCTAQGWSPTFSHGGEVSRTPTLLTSLGEDMTKRPSVASVRSMKAIV